MYRVFEALDEVVTIIEEARGVPMTSSCVVPRGDALELLDIVRDAIPAELDDAQDVLDRRDEIVGTAEHDAAQTVRSANAQAEHTVTEANAEAEQTIADAREHAERIVAEARAEAERTVAAGQAEYAELVERARDEADRMVLAGKESYQRSVDEGRAEQARLVQQTEVVRAAHAESARIIDAAHAEAQRERADCDDYVDGKLAEFEGLLSQTVSAIGNGRDRLRPYAAPASSVPPSSMSQAMSPSSMSQSIGNGAHSAGPLATTGVFDTASPRRR